MRKTFLSLGAVGLAMSSLAAAANEAAESARAIPHYFTRGFGTRSKRKFGNSIAGRNRWTGQPHKDSRAVERLARQKVQVEKNRASRAAKSKWARNGHNVTGLSRSGKTVYGECAA